MENKLNRPVRVLVAKVGLDVFCSKLISGELSSFHTANANDISHTIVLTF